MKPLLPLLLGTVFLCGCPDAKLPKTPPKIPEPKAASANGNKAVPVSLASSNAQKTGHL